MMKKRIIIPLCAALLLCGCADKSAESRNSQVSAPSIVTTSAPPVTTTETPKSSLETEETPPYETEIQPDPIAETAETEHISAESETAEVIPEESNTSQTTEDNLPAETQPSDVAADGEYNREFFADDLFIGDSISTGLYLYDKIDWQNVAASVGNTPYKAYSTEIEFFDGSYMTPLDYAVLRQPKRILIMLGSNGMASSWDIESMKGSYKTLLEKLAEACPESEVICISVPPVTYDTSYTTLNNNDISDFNAYLEGLCGEKGLRYIDLYSRLIDDTGYFSQDYAAVDGLHFQGYTYDVMLGYIQNELS